MRRAGGGTLSQGGIIIRLLTVLIESTVSSMIDDLCDHSDHRDHHAASAA
jgi:hypothetical protein